MNLAEMSASELVGWVMGGLLALSAIIQISPIKLNPWSWIAKKVGHAINKEVIDKVDGLENDLKDMKDAQDERNARNARTKILEFGDELLHSMKHSEEAFNDILDIITEYEQYCQDHPNFKNKRTERTVDHIVKTYDRCRAEHTFLR